MREEFSRAALLLGEEALQNGSGKPMSLFLESAGSVPFAVRRLPAPGSARFPCSTQTPSHAQTSTGRSSRCKAQSDGRRPK